MIYKSTYRIKRKYFIMLMKLERSSSQRIIALHDLQSTFTHIIQLTKLQNIAHLPLTLAEQYPEKIGTKKTPPSVNHFTSS